jgi:hypothetical protein
MLAVNVIALLYVDGSSEEFKDVVEVALFTVSTSAADVLARSMPLPLYTALMSCEPPGRDFVVKLVYCPTNNWTEDLDYRIMRHASFDGAC